MQILNGGHSKTDIKKHNRRSAFEGLVTMNIGLFVMFRATENYVNLTFCDQKKRKSLGITPKSRAKVCAQWRTLKTPR